MEWLSTCKQIRLSDSLQVFEPARRKPIIIVRGRVQRLGGTFCRRGTLQRHRELEEIPAAQVPRGTLGFPERKRRGGGERRADRPQGSECGDGARRREAN